jgi:hypothetical protein
MGELTLAEARDLCDRWSVVSRNRDHVVREAILAGLTKSEIALRTGLARTTIDRILTVTDDMNAQVNMTREHIGDHNEHNDMPEESI